MKPYTITVELKPLAGKPTREQVYQLYATDRDDAIDFVRRVHRVDFKRVVSCHVEKADGNESISVADAQDATGAVVSAPRKRNRSKAKAPLGSVSPIQDLGAVGLAHE